MLKTSLKNVPEPSGFNVPVCNRENDHLNRWAFAREIFTAATMGPKDWSVRIGVYGEWGTGKTSVLHFVSLMAKKNDHIVVWFNPWGYSSRDALWREFVLRIYKSIEERVGGTNNAASARRKAALGRVAEIVKAVAPAVVKNISEGAGNIAESGIQLVKNNFSFGPEDLRNFHELLGQSRVVVLIDDLDRTAAELVPEILYALKEIMDVPGFSFVCAFDPSIVGQVLGRHHPGLGDGVKFLEKIIDYPRWIPPASPEGLIQVALEERAAHCPFVPAVPLEDAVALLPRNPRAIRQFIRLLATLKPQIERYAEQELKWPLILAANLLKVRYPQLAHTLLRNHGFWSKWTAAALFVERTENSEDQATELIQAHIAQSAKIHGFTLSPSETSELSGALTHLCNAGVAGILLAKEQIWELIDIAERPAAVTLKELGGFLDAWRSLSTTTTIDHWIAEHSKSVECSEETIFRKLIVSTIEYFSNLLLRADTVVGDATSKALGTDAKAIFDLIKALLGMRARCAALRAEELETLFERLGANSEFSEQALFNLSRRSRRPFSPIRSGMVRTTRTTC